MKPLTDEQNIVLIGMPGAGKSTVGVLLAKATNREFLDTDVFIQAREGRPLQDIVNTEGLRRFCHIEERHLLALDVRRHVLATGGSAVYSNSAMGHLRSNGVVVYLALPLPELKTRLDNLATRGVVIAEGHTLEGLYQERRPLYEAWADLTVDCVGKNQDQVVTEVLGELGAV